MHIGPFSRACRLLPLLAAMACEPTVASLPPIPAEPQPQWAPAARRAAGLVLLAAPERMPFHGTACETPEGYMVDLARECLALRGLTVEYLNVTRERALAGTLDGTFDGALGLVPAEAPGLVFPGLELARDPLALVILDRPGWNWAGLSGLDSLILGLPDGLSDPTPLDGWLALHGQDPHRVQYADGRDALKINLHKLLAGRIDVLVDSEVSVFYLARRMGIVSHLRPVGRLTGPRALSIGFSPATGTGAPLAEALTLGLADLRQSGRLAQILGEYGLEDWQDTP